MVDHDVVIAAEQDQVPVAVALFVGNRAIVTSTALCVRDDVGLFTERIIRPLLFRSPTKRLAALWESAA
jgi:hypothetical protein